jgi:hypothetical protein
MCWIELGYTTPISCHSDVTQDGSKTQENI